MVAMKRWQFWLGIAISLAFLTFALRGLKIDEMLGALEGANYWWLLPGIGIYFIGLWVRAWRWHYLLRPVKSIRTAILFPLTAIGYMGNNIYPARAGELLRAFLLNRLEDVPVSASLATIIVERIFDGVVMLGFVFINLPELARLNVTSGFIGSIQAISLWGAGIFIGVLVVFLFAAMFPKRTDRVVQWLIRHVLPPRYQEKTLGIVQRFLSGLAALRSPADALMIFFTSIIIWLLETGKYWFVMHAFSFSVSFFTLMLMNGIVNLATTIPSAPGYIGTFDAPGIAVLTAYGVDKSIAAGYTIVLHVALWLPVTLLGAFFLARMGIRWREGIQALRDKDFQPESSDQAEESSNPRSQ